MIQYSFYIKDKNDYLIQSNKLYLLGYNWEFGANPHFEDNEFPIKLWISENKVLQFSSPDFDPYFEYGHKEIQCKLLHYKQIKFLKNIHKYDTDKHIIDRILKNGYYEENDIGYLNSLRRLHGKDERTHTISQTS